MVFLDMDGCLVTRRCYHQAEPWPKPDTDCVAALNQLTTPWNAGIVVSSVWRLGKKWIGMTRILHAAGVAAPVVGITPYIDEACRGDEIAAWLRTTPTTRFVILDDDCDMGLLGSKLIQTEMTYGFHVGLIARALQVLEETAPMLQLEE